MSVTHAVRTFSDLLNRVYYQGITVELERGNNVVAKLSPADPVSPLNVKDLNKFFAELPSLADDVEAFSKNLTDIRKHIPIEQNPWD